MAYRLRIGTFDFPGTFGIVEDRLVNVVPQQKLARANGARTIGGTLDKRIIRVQGAFVSGPIGGVTIRTELDSLKQACKPNTPATMYAGRDDRYLRNVSCQNLPELMEVLDYDKIVKLDLDFIAGDAHYYSTTLTTDTWAVGASGQTRNITPGGIDDVYPTYKITVGTGGTANFTIQNTTTGKQFTIAGTVNAADVIVVDTLAQTVTIGGVNKRELFDGIWLFLKPGVINTLQETYSGGATITQIITEHRNRFL